MVMTALTGTNQEYLSLKEEFLIDLAKNIKNFTFQESENILRWQLKKEIDEGKLF